MNESEAFEPNFSRRGPEAVWAALRNRIPTCGVLSCGAQCPNLVFHPPYATNLCSAQNIHLTCPSLALETGFSFGLGPPSVFEGAVFRFAPPTPMVYHHFPH